MGCVLPAGLGQAPARQAAIKAGLPKSVQATTVNKVCGSGMQTVIMGDEAIRTGNADIIVAGGMESMTNAPYLLKKHRSGARIGHDTAYDHMFLDGLEDAYDKGRLMGTFAEDTAKAYQITRDAQDVYAHDSLMRARAAAADGTFGHEIVAVAAHGIEVGRDERPHLVDPDRIPTVKPAFRDGGSVTAANSSAISDGAAALVLMALSTADRLGITPLARLVGHATHAQAPAWFTTAPAGAVRKLLDRIGWTPAVVDLFEINEAFAVVALAAIRDLGLSRDTVNVHGGACAIGHPIGASGARILVTLLNALESHHLKRGVASLCIGGGEATAVAVERFE
jgi:acetyl-CoA C-acetyltransferase